MRLRQRLTFWEAIQLMIDAKIIEGQFSVGTNATRTDIVIPAGGIDARKDGFFRRSDVCRLIGYAQMAARDEINEMQRASESRAFWPSHDRPNDDRRGAPASDAGA